MASKPKSMDTLLEVLKLAELGYKIKVLERNTGVARNTREAEGVAGEVMRWIGGLDIPVSRDFAIAPPIPSRCITTRPVF